ncbi:MAG: DNA topoisomerase IB [Ilumatobacter sp.]|nr:DNA topoisomerase IB [Ilumatobacter sp.]
MSIRVPAELTERDAEVLAPAAGLVYLPDDEPGITRVRRGKGFSYVDAFGKTVHGAERDRIEALAIPPAWVQVWISPDPRSYLQASGLDDAGRKQYRYHDDFLAFSEHRKFARLPYFGQALPIIRKVTQKAVDREPVGARDHAIAAAIRLIDTCLLRVGNHRSAANGHYGATTLTVEHVIDDDTVELEYAAKSGQTRTIVVEDDDMADILVDLADDADDELFWFEDGEGERRRATASDINEFIAEHAGPAFSAKDFRTWGGSKAALEARAEGDEVLEAVDAAAEELGNTRAVARNSYIHPQVIEAADEQVEAAWNSSRTSKWGDRADHALRKLLS